MAPRKRINGPDWLPVRCYLGKSAFEYRPKSGGCVRLGKFTTPKEIILANYNAARLLHEEPTGAFSELIRGYLASVRYSELAVRTKIDYARYAKKLDLVFGKMNRNRIKPHHIRQYMDKRKEGGVIVQANREKSFLSSVFSWAYENGKVNMNPVKGVRKFKETPRPRYIEDWEYNLWLDQAYIKWPLLAAAMEISYCCAAREADVWNLEREKLLEEGIKIRQGKTGKIQIKEWNPRLRAAVDLALSVQKLTNFKWVFCDKKGHHPAQGALQEWALLAKRKAKSEYNGVLNIDFTFHDIKAKAISDFEGNKQEFSGHKTQSQVAIYDRKVKVTPTLK
jgi:site-specific recombinase XerC